MTLDGSASSDPDGEALTYAWTAPAGVTLSDPSSASPTFTAPDVSADTPLTFTLQVCDEANPTSLCATDTVVVTVQNVAQPSNISINDVSMAEGNSGQTAFQFTVSLDAPQTAPVTVDFATADGTATAPSDYTANSGTVTFAPGVTSQTVTVQGNGDTTVEPNETFNVNLSNATGNATIADAQGLGTIVNDDQAVEIDAAGDVIVHGPVHASKNGCDHGSKHGWEHGWEHGSECSKVYLFRVSNLGDSPITVDPKTDIDAVVNVNGTANGSVSSLTGAKTIKPGHSRVFPLRWISDGTVVAGDTVEFTACVNLAGDVNTANNCDSETRTAVGKHHPDHGHGDEDHGKGHH